MVGFYGSMSSSVLRLYQLAREYQKSGALTVAGGKHIEFLPQEALDNGIDIAVLGEGEETIKELLSAWEICDTAAETAAGFDQSFHTLLPAIKGIVYREHGAMLTTSARQANHDLDSLPYPDFNLLRFGKVKLYPVNRTRGCNMHCEFCTVKDKVRTASPQWLANQIIQLSQTRNARTFFDTSDHFAANRAEAMEFCNILAAYQKKTGVRLDITVQTRITDARYPELLQAMKSANIHMVAIGYESPIDEELVSMNKGYLSKDMVAWSKVFHSYGFYIHAMMIFGYPVTREHNSGLGVKERVRRFRAFIREAKVDTAQVLLAIPFAGTGLRERLEKDKSVFPLSVIGWEYYDGQFPLFEPDDGSTPEENIKAITSIMGRFYSGTNVWRLILSFLFHFPRHFILPLLGLLTFRVGWLVRAFHRWYHDHFRNYFIRFGGSVIVHKWKKHLKQDGFLEKLRREQAHPMHR